MVRENDTPISAVRLEALKIAASFFTAIHTPDAAQVVSMAKTFEEYVTGGETGKATPNKRGPYKPRKTQAPGES